MTCSRCWAVEDERNDLTVALGILADEVASLTHPTPADSLDYLHRKVTELETTMPHMARCYRLAYDRLAEAMGVEAERKAWAA